MKHFLIVGAGGFFGASLRYLLYRTFISSSFPHATLIINVLGCFAIGFIAAYLHAAKFDSEILRIFLVVGFLGGFTTYSSFGLDSYMLLKGSQFLLLFINVAAHLLLGLAAVFFGFKAFEILS